jgi:hypothetical protein
MAKSTAKYMLTFYPDAEAMRQIQTLAEKEDRPMTRVVLTLVREALDARRAKRR